MELVSMHALYETKFIHIHETRSIAGHPEWWVRMSSSQVIVPHHLHIDPRNVPRAGDASFSKERAWRLMPDCNILEPLCYGLNHSLGLSAGRLF